MSLALLSPFHDPWPVTFFNAYIVLSAISAAEATTTVVALGGREARGSATGEGCEGENSIVARSSDCTVSDDYIPAFLAGNAVLSAQKTSRSQRHQYLF